MILQHRERLVACQPIVMVKGQEQAPIEEPDQPAACRADPQVAIVIDAQGPHVVIGKTVSHGIRLQNTALRQPHDPARMGANPEIVRVVFRQRENRVTG